MGWMNSPARLVDVDVGPSWCSTVRTPLVIDFLKEMENWELGIGSRSSGNEKSEVMILRLTRVDCFAMRIGKEKFKKQEVRSYIPFVHDQFMTTLSNNCLEFRFQFVRESGD